MSYTVQQITALTDKYISVLLADDLAVDIDREAFEEYVTNDDGLYTFSVPSMHPDVDGAIGYITLAQYWVDFSSNDTPHIADLNDYISQSVSTRIDIDVVRAWENITEYVDKKTLDLIAAYGTAKYNQGKNENL